MRLIGIDCATDPRKTGLALARLSRRGRPRIEELLCPASEAERVERLVANTSLRLAPVFLGFSLVLSALLFLASRAARRWPFECRSRAFAR